MKIKYHIQELKIPQLTKREKESKKKALREAIEQLKMESTPDNNLVIQENVCNLANQSKDVNTWSALISVQTIKSKNPEGFGYEARNEIINFKKDLNKMVQSAEKQLLEKIKLLNQKNDLLFMQVAKLLDNEIELKKEIGQLELLIDRKNEEIILLRKTLSKRD